MKQPEDTKTLELLLLKRRGRPSTGKAKTPAQRQQAYRIRQSVKVDNFQLAAADLLLAWSELPDEVVRKLLAKFKRAVKAVCVPKRSSAP